MELERTELVSREKAEILFAALRQAPERFAGVELVRDHHVIGSDVRYFVRFARLEVAMTAEHRRMSDIRVERAVHQFREMEFLPIEDREGWYDCLHFYPESLEAGVYEVSVGEFCTCPDFGYRLNRTPVQCKHQGALRIHLGLPSLAEERDAERRLLRDLVRIAPADASPEQRRAAFARAMALDF